MLSKLRRINWRSPKTWAIFVALNLVLSPTVWIATLAWLHSNLFST